MHHLSIVQGGVEVNSPNLLSRMKLCEESPHHTAKLQRLFRLVRQIKKDVDGTAERTIPGLFRDTSRNGVDSRILVRGKTRKVEESIVCVGGVEVDCHTRILP